MKHIESIQPEYAAEELERIVREEGDATASAALSRLLHDWTGCAIPPLATTPQSEVEELVPLCLSILRRHWTTPLTALGDGTTPMSLADLMRRLIGDRVQGNEAWSIPPANANIPTAVSALRDRKIGGADVPDGMSLQHILGSDEGLAAVANLSDDNDWVMNCGISFPDVNRIENNAQSFFKEIDPAYTIFGGQHKELILPNMEWTTYPAVVKDGNNTYNRYNRHTLSQSTVLETLSAPKLRGVSWIVNGAQGLEVLSLPELEFIGISGCNRPAAIHNCANLKEINLPKLSYLQGWYAFGGIWANCPKLEKVVLGTLHQWYLNNYNDRTYNSEYLVHLEIGAGTNCNLDFGWWNPTTALSERLPEFLSNFQTYIADRVADMSGKTALTLTLSAAVYAALQAQEGQTILATLTSKNWTVAQA